MRKCRFCEAEIEHAAVVCPHCGRDLFPGRKVAAVETPAAPVTPAIARVSVVDVDMPFASMVGFMVKWALAAIPAVIILGFVVGLVTLIVGGLASACAVPRVGR